MALFNIAPKYKMFSIETGFYNPINKVEYNVNQSNVAIQLTCLGSVKIVGRPVLYNMTVTSSCAVTIGRTEMEVSYYYSLKLKCSTHCVNVSLCDRQRLLTAGKCCITTHIVPSLLTNSNTNNRVSTSSVPALDSSLFVLHIITILSSTFIFSQTVLCCIVCMYDCVVLKYFLYFY